MTVCLLIIIISNILIITARGGCHRSRSIERADGGLVPSGQAELSSYDFVRAPCVICCFLKTILDWLAGQSSRREAREARQLLHSTHRRAQMENR